MSCVYPIVLSTLIYSLLPPIPLFAYQCFCLDVSTLMDRVFFLKRPEALTKALPALSATAWHCLALPLCTHNRAYSKEDGFAAQPFCPKSILQAAATHEQTAKKKCWLSHWSSWGVGTGIHPTDCYPGDRFDHRRMIDRGDFLNLHSKISQKSFVCSVQLQAGNILAGSCPGCSRSLCLSRKQTHVYVCTTKCTEGVTKQMYMQQLLNCVFILQSQQSAPRKLHIDQNYCTIKTG